MVVPGHDLAANPPARLSRAGRRQRLASASNVTAVSSADTAHSRAAAA